ncbi:MAG: hypothetical protein R6U11_00290 [Bacteroidales bacterium]
MSGHTAENFTNTLEKYANKKQIPIELRRAILKALSFYPKLKNIKIDFVFSERVRKSVMQAQPRYMSMFGSRRQRSYLVKISRNFELKGSKTPMENLPEKVLIGWIGHELGHIMDYLKRNNWSMILFGIGYYTSKSFILSAERIADTYAIDYGLGNYIMTTKDFILHKAHMPEKYIKRIKRLYLSPEEVMDIVENRLSGD